MTPIEDPRQPRREPLPDEVALLRGGVQLHTLDVCDSTQDEVRVRLAGRAAGQAVAVRARSQRAGRGREGRSWSDPPGEALLLSVGVRGPLALRVLEDLPRRVADTVVDAAASVAGIDAHHLQWKAPNDLVAADGAKLGGILVDSRTTGDRVDEVVVGIGLNVRGDAFTTPDGRAATTLASVVADHEPAAATAGRVVARELAAQVAVAIANLLDGRGAG